MSPYGNFNLARQELKKIALKALYKLRKDMGKYFRGNIKLTMKLFDALISPIPFYASEVWGIDCNEHFRASGHHREYPLPFPHGGRASSGNC